MRDDKFDTFMLYVYDYQLRKKMEERTVTLEEKEQYDAQVLELARLTTLQGFV